MKLFLTSTGLDTIRQKETLVQYLAGDLSNVTVIFISFAARPDEESSTDNNIITFLNLSL